MSKVTSVSIPDIIKRRYRKNINLKILPQQPKQLITSQQFDKNYIDTINEMISKFNDLDSKLQPQLNIHDKNIIIDFMSEKTGLSFNKHALIENMAIRKIKNINNSFTLIDKIGSKMRKLYFVLTGKIYVYKQQKKKMIKDFFGGGMDLRRTTTSNLMWSSVFEEIQYKSLDKFQEQYTDYVLLQQVQSFSGFGESFIQNSIDNTEINKNYKNLIILASDAIIITINISQNQGNLINSGGLDNDIKLQILNNFPVFNPIKKKLNMYISYLQIKKFTKNQYIYKINDNPQFLYLIVKGQIRFQTKVSVLSKKGSFSSNRKVSLSQNNGNKFSSRKTSVNVSPSNKNSTTQINLNTQTMSTGAYFGQEEIINKTKRTLNARCQSSTCYLLCFPKDKFQKLLDYSDFQQLIKRGVYVKSTQRDDKIQMANDIHNQFQIVDNDKRQNDGGTLEDFTQNQQQVVFGQTKINFNNPNSISRGNNKKVKIMHGNLVRSYNDIKPGKQVGFSMLKANPDMYQSTLKKFRRWTMKPQIKVKPQVNWNLKRVWKVLNLDNVLGQDVDISSPQGLKFYETHRRYSNHVNQVKSLRPKTSSSNYRTKLQYIAYLQRFSNEKTIIN